MLFLYLFMIIIVQVYARDHQLPSPQTKRIINGFPISSYDAPFYAMLYYGGVHSGGMIIARNVILTAASVVDGFKDSDIEIFVGVTTISDTYSRFPYDNNSTVKHPQYRPGFADYDCALMFLASDLSMGGNVQRIALSRTPAPVNSVVSLCGFGYARCEDVGNPGGRCVGVASDQLRGGDFIVSGYGGNTMYATGRDGVSSCFGDFGGPVIQNKVAVGIASLISYPNCTGTNLIVSIPAVLPWILATTRQRNAALTTSG